jgi:hypothetical protein
VMPTCYIAGWHNLEKYSVNIYRRGTLKYYMYTGLNCEVWGSHDISHGDCRLLRCAVSKYACLKCTTFTGIYCHAIECEYRRGLGW